jgi:Mg2+ and Co2+ transporter CorA
MLEDNERTQKMDNLSKMGYMFLPPTLIAGLFGMNVFDTDSIDIGNYGGTLIASILLIASMIYGYTKGTK